MPLVNLSQPQLDLLRELLGDHQDDLRGLAAKSAYLERTVGESLAEADRLAELLASVSQGGTPESVGGRYGFWVVREFLYPAPTVSTLSSPFPSLKDALRWASRNRLICKPTGIHLYKTSRDGTSRTYVARFYLNGETTHSILDSPTPNLTKGS